MNRLFMIGLLISFFVVTETAHAQTSRRRASAPTNPAATEGSLPVTVVLKDGQTLKGKFVTANAQRLSIVVGSSLQEIEMSEVGSLVFVETKATAAPTLESPSGTATREAVKALKKLESATSVGVTRSEYGTRLIDAKAVVDDCLSRISDGELKVEIEAAIREYSFASHIWQQMNDASRIAGPTSEAVYEWAVPRFIVDEYKVKPHSLGIGRDNIFLTSEVLSGVWKVAREHLDKAARLLGQ